MTADTNKNSDTTPKSTETVMENILVVTEIKFLQFGIQYFFNPLQKTCLLVPLESIKNKDLVNSIFYGTPSQSSVVFHTSNVFHEVYEDAIKLQVNDDLVEQIYKVGDPFLQIIDF